MTPTRRSADTKATILDAARTSFAAVGYKGTTIRGIARGAEIDPALVVRYFGSKAELFAAAIDVDLRIPDLAKTPKGKHGERLVEHFLSRWDSATVEGDVLLSLLRSATTDPDAAAKMRELFARQLAPALRPLVADQSELLVRAGLVAGQMLGLALTRFVIELPPVVAMTPSEVAAAIGPTVQRYLRGALPSQASP